jgi:hypothetical protein
VVLKFFSQKTFSQPKKRMEIEKNHCILSTVEILRTTPEKIRRYRKIDKASGNE